MKEYMSKTSLTTTSEKPPLLPRNLNPIAPTHGHLRQQKSWTDSHQHQASTSSNGSIGVNQQNNSLKPLVNRPRSRSQPFLAPEARQPSMDMIQEIPELNTLETFDPIL